MGEGTLLEMEPLFEVDRPKPAVRSAVTLIGKTVDRKRVTTDEARTATAILDAYNEIAGTNLGGQVWLRKIIMRMREHPELSVDEHREIIRRNFAAPWWRNAASPSVIYGSDGQFERSILCDGKSKPGTRAERKSDKIRRLLGSS